MLEEQFVGTYPIMISEVTYCLIVHTLAIQFKDTLVKHFSAHQFGVVTRDGCETMIHGV
jgi:hypothetical protein